MHGGRWYQALQEIDWPSEGLLDLSASISPFGPGPDARRLWPGLLDRLDRYPDPDYTALRRAIAGHYGVQPDQVAVVAGAMQAIDELLARLAPPILYVVEPSFSEYAIRAQARHIPVRWIQEPEQMEGPGVLILANPANPTGIRLTSPGRERWQGLCETQGVTILWDEAFLEFLPNWREHSMLTHVTEGSDWVMGSLTKFYGLAALRIGFVVGERSRIRELQDILPAWRVSWPAAEMARAALGNQDYFGETRQWLIKERQWLSGELQPLVSFMSESIANFLFVVPQVSSRELLAFLRENGILLRDTSGFHGVPQGGVRIAVKRHRDSQRLLSLWRTFSTICR